MMRKSWLPWIGLASVLALAAFARTYRLDEESLWHDEATMVPYLTAPSLLEFFHTQVQIDPAIMPLYFTGEYYWAKIVGNSEFTLRMPSVTFGLLTVVVIYGLGMRLFGTTGAFVAALAAACSKSYIYQSQEIRMYALTYLLAALSLYTLHVSLITNRKRWWCANIVTNSLLLATFLLSAPLIVAEGIVIAATQPKRIRIVLLWAVAHLPAAIPLGLWVISFDKSAINEQLDWVRLPTVLSVLGILSYWLTGAVLKPLSVPKYIWLTMILRVFHGVAVAAVAGYLYKVRRSRAVTQSEEGFQKSTALLVVSTFLLPTLMLCVVSYVLRPCLASRYVGYSAIPWFLMLGGAVSALPFSWRINAVVVLVALYLTNISSYDRPIRPNLRGPASTVNAAAVPNDAVYISTEQFRPALTYYLSRKDIVIHTTDDFAAQAIANAEQGGSSWIILPRILGLGKPETVNAALAGHPVVADRWIFPGNVNVYVYHLRPAPQLGPGQSPPGVGDSNAQNA